MPRFVRLAAALTLSLAAVLPVLARGDSPPRVAGQSPPPRSAVRPAPPLIPTTRLVPLQELPPPPESAPPTVPPPPAACRRPLILRRSRAIGRPFGGTLRGAVQLPCDGDYHFTWDPVLRRAPNRSWRRWGTAALVETTLAILEEHAFENPLAGRVGVGDLSRRW